MDSKTIGHKLRALRGEMDAKTVADALGISTSALFYVRAWRTYPPRSDQEAHRPVLRPECRRNFFRRVSTYCAHSKGGEEDENRNHWRTQRNCRPCISGTRAASRDCCQDSRLGRKHHSNAGRMLKGELSMSRFSLILALVSILLNIIAWFIRNK